MFGNHIKTTHGTVVGYTMTQVADSIKKINVQDKLSRWVEDET